MSMQEFLERIKKFDDFTTRTRNLGDKIIQVIENEDMDITLAALAMLYTSICMDLDVTEEKFKEGLDHIHNVYKKNRDKK